MEYLYQNYVKMSALLCYNTCQPYILVTFYLKFAFDHLKILVNDGSAVYVLDVFVWVHVYF